MTDLRKAEIDKIYLATGRAVTRFSFIEQELARLFCLMADVDWHRGEVIFASIVSFQARVNICSNLNRFSPLPGDLASIWPKMEKRLAANLSKRNQLAHSTSMVAADEASAEAPIGLLIPYFSVGSAILGNDKNYTVKQLEKIADDFQETVYGLIWMRAQIDRRFEPEAIKQVVEPAFITEFKNDIESKRLK